MPVALTKFRGMLVLAEYSHNESDRPSRCPECGATEFYTRDGWIECDCGFAILESGYKRICDV